MFYKNEEELNEWHTGNKISFPNGITLSADNKMELLSIIEKDGWFWSNEPPAEYTEWLKSQDYNNNNAI